MFFVLYTYTYMLRSKVKLEFQVKLYIEIVKIHQCTKIFELGSVEILLLE
jgi:hypothetical protein